jgi:hypothetical protein
MLTIHHATQKKAEAAGIQLIAADDRVEAFWPQRNQRYSDISAKNSLSEMAVLKAIITNADAAGYRATWKQDVHGAPGTGWVIIGDDKLLEIQPARPSAIMSARFHNDEWDFRPDGTIDDLEEPDEAPDLEDTFPQANGHAVANTAGPTVAGGTEINGIPTDGALAYKAGVVTADCPFPEDSDEAQAWYEAWDAAADAAPEQDEDGKTGSVVKDEYRARYREQGHPNTCGDWLAKTLDNFCQNDAGTNLELFEAICAANGVNVGPGSKYKRSGIGWQGRIRMTGRNMLTRRVYEAGGTLKLPFQHEGNDTLKAPGDWMADQTKKRAKREAA